MYSFIRSLLFLLPAEFSHNLGLRGLKLLYLLGLSRFLRARTRGPALEVMGLHFSNPVGLAAGLDKNADYIDALGALGFGFIEVGTVTPRPQPGNPRPRLFRLKPDQAIINRMGFNNKGLEHLVKRLKTRRYKGIVGVNIGKNLSTPVDHAVDDYLSCLHAVYPYADYVVVNLSSPNTPGLRQLQFGEHLDQLLSALKSAQLDLGMNSGRHVPLLVKIAPDLSSDELEEISAALLRHGVDGLTATNTTVSREGLHDARLSAEAGGLSGPPVQEKASRVIAMTRRQLGDSLPIIGVGGIHDAASAAEKKIAGASLLQVYTGFIYQGPTLIDEAIEGFVNADQYS